MSGVNASDTAKGRPGCNWRRAIAVAGPGLVVMLADTDAGSIITAAQSGAQWGYGLLLLQVVLIPILFVVQELTVRLGVVTRKGHAELIREQFGIGWAWFSVLTLAVSCIGALLSELSGLAGVGLLMGVPTYVTMMLIVAVLIFMAYRSSYLSVERVAIGVGLFELMFLAVAWRAQPGLAEVAAGSVDIAWRDPKYLYLVAANLGAVIMPWMVFYQQSSVVEKKLTLDDQPMARVDTAVGAVLTQIIMMAVLVATAAALYGKTQSGALDTVQQIAEAMTPVLGEVTGKLLFGLGLSGSAVVATIVVTLTAARTLGEVLGVKHSLEHEPHEAPWFYGIYTVTLVAGGLLIMSGVDLVNLSVGVQVMNALLLPVVLGFLYLLALRLPEPHRLRGAYAVIVGVVIAVSVGFAVYSGLFGLWG
jgi:NRAMP (natural resistance-associated macrophage protein)-like metal ion transporter